MSAFLPADLEKIKTELVDTFKTKERFNQAIAAYIKATTENHRKTVKLFIFHASRKYGVCLACCLMLLKCFHSPTPNPPPLPPFSIFLSGVAPTRVCSLTALQHEDRFTTINEAAICGSAKATRRLLKGSTNVNSTFNVANYSPQLPRFISNSRKAFIYLPSSPMFPPLRSTLSLAPSSFTRLPSITRPGDTQASGRK